LRDAAGEFKWKFSLSRALALAQSVPLFANCRVYITPSVDGPSPAEITTIVRGAQGTRLTTAPKQFVRATNNDRNRSAR
jgi:hypothetical protein